MSIHARYPTSFPLSPTRVAVVLLPVKGSVTRGVPWVAAKWSQSHCSQILSGPVGTDSSRSPALGADIDCYAVLDTTADMQQSPFSHAEAGGACSTPHR